MSRVTSCVKSENGVEFLCVNGKRIDSVAYITYLAENGRYEDFAAAGYTLFSLSLFFGTNNLNEMSGSRSFSKGIFDNDKPDFSELDANIARILAVCPGAMILPRINVNPCEKWESEHPEELCDATLNPDPTHRRPCLASDLWLAEVKRMLAEFVAHIEASSYADHIIGYQLAGGNTEEWIAYDGNAFSGRRSRERFAKAVHAGTYPDTEQAYYQFLSDITADRVCALCAYLKMLTDRRLVVGAFFGYTYMLFDRTFGHAALYRLLQCDDVDFICAPISYDQARPIGMDHAYMVPLHTLKLHGKLYFSENDTRTHLSKPLNDHPYYTAPVWFGPDKQGSLAILKMHFARALINGHASWWFDMWGGWYADQDYMALMRQAREISLNASDSAPMAELAFLLDEKALACVKGRLPKDVCRPALRAAGVMGAPFHLYLADDFDGIKDRYKAFVLLEPVSTERSHEIVAYARKHRISLLEITEKNADVSAEGMREFCKQNDIFLYTDKNAVIYANKDYLLLHAVEDGEMTLCTPEEACLTDLFTGERIQAVRTYRRGDTFLLKKNKHDQE